MLSFSRRSSQNHVEEQIHILQSNINLDNSESKRQVHSKAKHINKSWWSSEAWRNQNSRNEWVFEWLLLWQACCDRITHSVEQIGPWVLAGPRGLSIAPRLGLSQRWAAHSMAVPWQTLSDSVTLPVWMQGVLLTPWTVHADIQYKVT